jgi:2-phosphosulfolactate phosphatase
MSEERIKNQPKKKNWSEEKQVRQTKVPPKPSSSPSSNASPRSNPKTVSNSPNKRLECKVAVREGEDGTDLAAEGRVAVIVDALRASATLCRLLEAGATEVWVVAEAENCQEIASAQSGFVTLGERHGKQIEGFALGNSPRAVQPASVQGRTVVMTTTTGALRILESQGAAEILIGCPRNLTAVAKAAAESARKTKTDIVVVAAGHSGGASGMSVEDLATASLIAGMLQNMGATLEPGGFVNIPAQALPELFRNCPNGRRLKEIGYGEDVPYCAEIDKTALVPYVADWRDLPNGDIAAVLRNFNRS